MLTKENASGFNPALAYPTYEYLTNSGKGYKARFDGGRIIPKPKGHREVVRYHNEDEHFTDYLKWNTEAHKDIPDRQLREHPYGIFIGTWRNARWHDEAVRRDLVEITS